MGDGCLLHTPVLLAVQVNSEGRAVAAIPTSTVNTCVVLINTFGSEKLLLE